MEGTVEILSRERRVKFQTLIWIFIILVSTSSAVSSQPVVITSDISPGEIVCPGEVIFICVTRGSAVIAWEYVGDRLEFNLRDTLGETRQGSRDPNTLATLINNTMENSTRVLESQLQITVSSMSSTPTVTCIHGRDNIPETFTFQVLADPGVPQVTANYTAESCELNISLTAPGNVATSDKTRFDIDLNGIIVRNVTNMTYSRNVGSCASLNVSISTVDRCGRKGPSTTVSVSPEFCDDSACTAASRSSPVSGLGPVWAFLAITVAMLVIMGPIN